MNEENRQENKRFKAENTESEPKVNQRYKESDIIKKFLNSDKGLSFLSKTMKDHRFDIKSDKILPQIDFLIDFYLSWASSVPVRRVLKYSKYDFLKILEEFCENSKDIKQEI